MCSVDTATVGREGGKPDVRDVERGQAGEIWYVAIRLQVPGLHASLRVPATHDGHVRLMAQLSNDPDDWSATTVITLDPSEEMTGPPRTS
jgi:hypothetical protein